MESNFSSDNENSKRTPSVNASDSNERKLARRLRIQARLKAAENESTLSSGIYLTAETEKSLISETIESSEDTLNLLYHEGKELVTNVMVASDAKEVARREAETEERNNRLEKLKEESALALEKLDEISSKWEAIMEINSPLDLYENMKVQKAKCLELIEQKNELIKSFQMELKLADEKFMKGRKAMYDELALLTRRIDEQILLMKKAYRIEMNRIEDSVDVTRNEIMEKHQKTWQSLYNQREKDEKSNIESKFQLVESFHEELDKLHVDHEEKYRATRIHLETDIQILEQELEQVKALCLLNSEKLDYNYQVLKKREEENVYIKNHQKRRLNKLQDTLNILKKKIDEKKQSTESEYNKLRKDVERYYANIIAIEKKAERSSQVNSEKFESIWDMKDEEAKGLLNQILSADMVIHEQILGIEWTPPGNTNFNKMDLPSYKTAAFVVGNIKKRKREKEGIVPVLKPKMDVREGDDKPEVVEGQKRILRHIFELIADQSGFLMEEKLDKLLSPYTEDEKTFVRLDNVFVAMDIRTEKDVRLLRDVFLPYSTCLICEKQNYSASSVDLQNEAAETPKNKRNSRQHSSILQIRELEEKVSKLRIQAKAAYVEVPSTSEASPTKRNEFFGRRDTIREDKRESVDYRRRVSSVSGTSDTSVSTEVSEKGDNLETPPKSIDKQSVEEPKKVKCDITHPLVIEKIFVLKALKDFVSIYRHDRIRPFPGIEEKLEMKRFTISRLVSTEDILSYWENFKEAIPAGLENVWNGIFLALTRYLAVLQERHELNLKAKALRRQNLDLKRLLAYYKVSDVCGQFKFPKVLPVPNEPIELEEISNIYQKLSF